MEDKYAKLLGLEFWLPDWFREDENFITVTIPIGTNFSFSFTKKTGGLVSTKDWIILTFTHDNI
jgi:hypothetical protein